MCRNDLLQQYLFSEETYCYTYIIYVHIVLNTIRACYLLWQPVWLHIFHLNIGINLKWQLVCSVHSSFATKNRALILEATMAGIYIIASIFELWLAIVKYLPYTKFIIISLSNITLTRTLIIKVSEGD